MNRKEIEEMYVDDEPEILFADGFDSAIMGVVQDPWQDNTTRVLYSIERILKTLMDRDEMTYEDASEYFEFNIRGSYMGKYTPLFLDT
tara:strand:+ start:1021 stop:1284 length:264 start_codon:yes stop_codon:yes gene_type:complete